jgi:hypothetical protein
MLTNQQLKLQPSCAFQGHGNSRRAVVNRLFQNLFHAAEKDPVGFHGDMKTREPWEKTAKATKNNATLTAYMEDYRLWVGCSNKKCEFYKEHFTLGKCLAEPSIGVPRNLGKANGRNGI